MVGCPTSIICKIGTSFCTFDLHLGWDSAFCVQKAHQQHCFHIETSVLDQKKKKKQFACLEVEVLVPMGMPVIPLQDNTWLRHAKEW